MFGLGHKKRLNENFLGDKAYLGEQYFVVPYKRDQILSNFQKLYNSAVNSICVKVKHSIGCIKNFLCLKIPWRHKLYKHPVVFAVCLQVANINIKFFPLL